MKLREFLKVASLGNTRLTIKDDYKNYCCEEYYDYLTELDIEEYFDVKDNLENFKSIIFEPWWVEVMNKEVNYYTISYDEDGGYNVLYIVISEDDSLISALRVKSPATASILDCIDTLKEDEKVLKLCEEDGINSLEEISSYVYEDCIEGMSEDEKLVAIKEAMEQNMNWYLWKLKKYHQIYGNYEEYLISNCEEEEEKEIIHNWLDNFEK